MIRATQDGFAYERVAPGLLVRRIVKAGQFVPDAYFADAEGTTPVTGDAVTEQELAVLNEPPPGLKWQVDTTGESWTGEVDVTLASVTPATAPLAAGELDLVCAGTFDADASPGSYRVDLATFPLGGTVLPSLDVTDLTESSLTAHHNFVEAPAGNPGTGAAILIFGGQERGRVDFEWTAGATREAAAEPAAEAAKPASARKRRSAPGE
jgi:hypothetical protein